MGCNCGKYQEGGTIEKTRTFNEFEYNKLVDREKKEFFGYWSGYLWDITHKSSPDIVGKFNPKTKILYIFGNSDLNNPLVKWLQDNSKISREEYEKLANGGRLKTHKYANGSTVEGGGEYRSYINNIYRNQSEQSAREGLMNFASEQGFEISDVENALQVYKYDTEENTWGENYYTKVAIAKMVDMISGKYADGGGIGAYDYKTVDLRTEKGIKEAERLKEQGWKIVQMGFDTMQFERPKANSFRSVGRSIYAKGGHITSEISKCELEDMVGRKLDGWNDDIIYYGGRKYEKCFLRPHYKVK